MLTITLPPVPDYAISEPQEVNESSTGTITITLAEGEWADDLVGKDENGDNGDKVPPNKAKQKAFIDAFEAETEPEQWEKVKAAWKAEIDKSESDEDIFNLDGEGIDDKKNTHNNRPQSRKLLPHPEPNDYLKHTTSNACYLRCEN